MPNITGVIEEYFEKNGSEFIGNLYDEAQVAKLVRNYPGVDGNVTFPTASVDKPLLYGYDGAVGGEADSVSLEGVTMSTTLHKFVLEMDLGDDTMRGYKNWLKSTGMSSDDMSVVEYFMLDAEIRQALGMEIDQAAFMGKALYPKNDAKPLVETVNGFRRLIKNAAATSGNVNVVTTGAMDETNTLAGITKIYKAANSALQGRGAAIIVGFNTYNNYRDDYFTKRNNSLAEDFIMKSDFMGTRFHLGAGKSYVIPFAGMGDDDAVIVTPLSNLAYLYDSDIAANNLKIQEDGFIHRILTRVPLGFGVRKMTEKMVLCNDRLTSLS